MRRPPQELQTQRFLHERNQPVQAAVTAVDTKKSPRQDATIEELAKLTFHKPRNVPVAFTLTAKERFQVPGDDSIHRIARPVRDINIG